MGNVVFEPELTVGGIQTTFYNLDQIYALGKAVFSDHLNTQLEDVKPVLKILSRFSFSIPFPVSITLTIKLFSSIEVDISITPLFSIA